MRRHNNSSRMPGGGWAGKAFYVERTTADLSMAKDSLDTMALDLREV